eukprot:4952865-Amphidinium_carterae.1
MLTASLIGQMIGHSRWHQVTHIGKSRAFGEYRTLSENLTPLEAILVKGQKLGLSFPSVGLPSVKGLVDSDEVKALKIALVALQAWSNEDYPPHLPWQFPSH